MRLLYLIIISFLMITNGFTSNSTRLTDGYNDMPSGNPHQTNFEWKFIDESESIKMPMSQQYEEIELQWQFKFDDNMHDFLNNNNCFEIFLNNKLFWAKPCFESIFELRLNSNKIWSRLIKIPCTPGFPSHYNKFNVGFQTLINKNFKDGDELQQGQYARRFTGYDYTQHQYNSPIKITPHNVHFNQDKFDELRYRYAIQQNVSPCLNIIACRQLDQNQVGYFFKDAPYACFDVYTINASKLNLKKLSLLFYIDNGLNLSCQIERLYQ